MADLQSSLADFSTEIVHELDSFFDRQKRQAVAVDPVLARSFDELKTFSLRGGKFIRSYLVSIGYGMANPKNKGDIVKAAASVELHHKHILILDDIADQDERRYGGATLEYVYKDIFDRPRMATSFAMLDAVLLGSLSKELLLDSQFSPRVTVDCIRILDTVMFRDTLAGWQIHFLQTLDTIKESSPERFTKGLQLVTARYTFEGPLQIGLTLADNTNQDLEEAMVIYARHIGTAFQIHDDILGLFGDSNVTGKPVGNDVREGKKTLLLQEAFAKANSAEQQFLESVCGNEITPEQLKRVQQIVIDTGSLEKSKQTEEEFVEAGIKALENLPGSEQKELLIQLAHYIIQREK